MRIQFQFPKMIRIRADSDPQHWVGLEIYSWPPN
jgi:hypothetical protein